MKSLKSVTLALAAAVGVSAFAAPGVSPELKQAKALKVYPQAVVLQRSGPSAVIGLKVQVGVGDSCYSYAGYWWVDRKDAQGFAPLKRELNFGTAITMFPARPCAQIYKMQDVIVPIRLVRGDEESSAATAFNVVGVGSFQVSYDWKSGQAAVHGIATIE